MQIFKVGNECARYVIFCSFELNKNSFTYLFYSDIEATTLALDFRVTVLEENGGSDGNSSLAELEVRVETLEGTAADHETRLTTAETDIQGKFSQCFKIKNKIVIFINGCAK